LLYVPPFGLIVNVDKSLTYLYSIIVVPFANISLFCFAGVVNPLYVFGPAFVVSFVVPYFTSSSDGTLGYVPSIFCL